MINRLRARADARALTGAFAVGVTCTVLLAGAYAAGGAARANDDRAHPQQFASARSDRQTARQAPVRVVFASAQRQDIAGVPNDGGAHPLNAPVQAASNAGSVAAAAPFRGQTNRSDADCLATAVYYEARGEGQAGQQAVAQVILNRVRQPAFPKTICGVVFQAANGDCQFSFVCNGAMNGRREPAAWARARGVADRALGGFVMKSVGNAVSFHATRVAPSWGGMIRVAQVGQHIFYGFGRPTVLLRSMPSAPAPRLPTHATAVAVATAGPAYRILGPSAHVEPSQPKLILAADVTPVSPPPGRVALAAADKPAASASKPALSPGMVTPEKITSAVSTS